MRALLPTLLFLTVVGCASTPDVTVMRMGPMYPAREDGCSLEFLNGQHVELVAAGYEQLGLVSFSGATADLKEAASRLPGAVNAAACAMGGTSVSLNAGMANADVSVVQFSVWHAPQNRQPALPPAPGTAPSAI